MKALTPEGTPARTAEGTSSWSSIERWMLAVTTSNARMICAAMTTIRLELMVSVRPAAVMVGRLR